MPSMSARTACILDGGRAGDESANAAEAVVRRLLSKRGWSERTFRLCELEIGPCRGCFACWVKTPGICIIDDVAREIARTVVRSELVVFLTPVTFGGYSSELKKAVDRLIPLILPFFKLVGNEVHHVPRYARYPSLLGVGLLGDSSAAKERIFRRLIERNAINLHAPQAKACVIDPGDSNPGSILTPALRQVVV